MEGYAKLCTILATLFLGLKVFQNKFLKKITGTSLVAQWVRCRAPNAGGPGLIPGQGTRSLIHATTKSPHSSTKKAACRN